MFLFVLRDEDDTSDARLPVLVFIEEDDPDAVSRFVIEDDATRVNDVERLHVALATVDEPRGSGDVLEQRIRRFVGQGRSYRAEKDQEHRPAEYFEHRTSY